MFNFVSLKHIEEHQSHSLHYAAINFILSHPPGTRLGGGKNPLPGTVTVYENPPPVEKNRESKPHPRDIKLENFTNVFDII